MTDVIYALLAGVVLTAYSTIAVAVYTATMNRLPDKDCKRAGSHLRRRGSDGSGRVCGCRSSALPFALAWIVVTPFLGLCLGTAAISVWVSSGPQKWGRYIGEWLTDVTKK